MLEKVSVLASNSRQLTSPQESTTELSKISVSSIAQDAPLSCSIACIADFVWPTEQACWSASNYSIEYRPSRLQAEQQGQALREQTLEQNLSKLRCPWSDLRTSTQTVYSTSTVQYTTFNRTRCSQQQVKNQTRLRHCMHSVRNLWVCSRPAPQTCCP